MFAYLKGTVGLLEPTHAFIEVQGVGYEVLISLHTYGAIKEKSTIKLFTHFYVREDAQVLYGFYSTVERDLFRQLIGISGIGPNTCLVMLSSLSPSDIKKAIVNGDAAKIQAVKGIGSKTAQRVIIELKDKIAKEGLSSEISAIEAPSNNTITKEALSALTTLGINKTVAEKNIQSVLKTHGDHITLEELIKLALKN